MDADCIGASLCKEVAAFYFQYLVAGGKAGKGGGGRLRQTRE